MCTLPTTQRRMDHKCKSHICCAIATHQMPTGPLGRTVSRLARTNSVLMAASRGTRFCLSMLVSDSPPRIALLRFCFVYVSHTENTADPISANFTDAATLTYSMRERPHLVFDEQGQMVALTNGAAPICTGSATCGGRYNRVPPNRPGVPCTWHNGSDCRE